MRTNSRRGWTASYLIATSLLVLLNGAEPARAQTVIRSDAFVVIVNAANPIEDIGREELSNLFLKRALKWPGGGAANPVDLTAGASARGAFSRLVLHKSVSAVRTYWQQQIFSGREVPPPEKRSDAEVLEIVKSAPEAVGYVSASTVLPSGVKLLIVRDKP